MTMIVDITLFELRRLFRSPLSWTALAVVQFVLALLFYLFLAQYLQYPGIFTDKGISEIVIAGFYQSAGPVFLLATPFLTMRTVSEELRSGTISLLLSSPVPVSAVVIGKYLGISLFIICLSLTVSLMPASLMIGARIDYGQLLSAMAGLTLLAMSAVAVGLLASSLFQSAGIAALCTFSVFIVLWTIHLAAPIEQGTAFTLLNYLSLLHHYTPFTEGAFAPVDLFYFVLMSLACISIGIWRLDAMRLYHW